MSENEAPEIQIDAEDIILLLLEGNEKIYGKESLSGITRLEKLLFILQKETNLEGATSLYKFEPHNYGPFSKEVYEALDFLEGCELIQVRDRIHTSHYANVGESKLLEEISEEEPVKSAVGDDAGVMEKVFLLTENGRKVAKELRREVGSRHAEDIDKLYIIVQRYGNAPLNQLIRYVYRRYPEMTVKSIHPEAQRS